MVKKLATIKLQNKDYATVPTRIKEFREQCPNGVIETSSIINGVGETEFTATIFKDGNNRNVGSATGHAQALLKGDKAFEKLETIAIGRALAILGFMASGEVASYEEMEEFLTEKEAKKQKIIEDTIADVNQIESIEELRTYYKENSGKGKEVASIITARVEEIKSKK